MSPGRVLNLGFENVIVESDSSAGAVAGRVESGATLVSVWAFGRVVVSGNDASENAGGLVGDLLGILKGRGLRAMSHRLRVTPAVWWGMRKTERCERVGRRRRSKRRLARAVWWGLRRSDFRLEDSWAVGLPRSSDSTLAGGLIGDGVASANVLRSFWDISASGLEARADEAGMGVNSLADLEISSFGDENRFDSGEYPVLSGTDISKARQRAAILFGLTRVFSGTVRLAASGSTSLPLHEIEVDLNGAEANENCNTDFGTNQRQTLIYADVDLSLESTGDGCFARPKLPERFSSATLVLTIEFTAKDNGNIEVVTLRAEREIAYNGQTARAHYIANTDWTAEVDSTIYALRDDDGDMTINAYDWTPRGEASDFDLRVVGGVTMDGSKIAPIRFTTFGSCKRSTALCRPKRRRRCRPMWRALRMRRGKLFMARIRRRD